jgi:hypothetical protein
VRHITKEEVEALVERTVERCFRRFLDGDHETRVALHQRRAKIFGEGSKAAKRCDLLSRMREIVVSDK